MKKLLIPLMLASMPCLASQPTALGLLKEYASESGDRFGIDWQLDVDWQLNKTQVATVKKAPKGEVAEVAGLVIKMVAQNNAFAGMEPSQVPVVFSCPSGVVIVDKQMLSDRYKKGGCELVQDSI
jgi:predicted secreted protein